MTVEKRVKRVIAGIQGVSAGYIDLSSHLPDDIPVLVTRLTGEFGTGILRTLLPASILTIQNLVDAIRPAMESGSVTCTCSKCDYVGSGKDGANCPTGDGGVLTCRVY